MFPREVQKIISSYQIFGVIPLDKTLHFALGLVVTLVGVRLGVRLRWIFLALLVAGAVKEYFDTFVYTSHWVEHGLDILAGLSYVVLLGGVRWLRASVKARRLPEDR